ncbi:MAG TPA: ferrochelatase [Burkholderiales bacterium]|nr:ferrochelatase [Burkholderiales bacterium]
MRYFPEPRYRHGATGRIGILLVNVGTPAAPTPRAVREYLAQFLWDPRVVEIPRPLWWLILHGIVLRRRPKRSAEKYAKIWTPDGSPLKVHTQKQASLLQGYLGERLRYPHAIAWGMRYGEPTVESALLGLRGQGCDRVLVLPLYPQYSASTTGSAFDAVFEAMKKMRNAPALRLVRHFHDHPAYIAALARQVNDYWMTNGRPDKLVLSFHGVPRFSLERGDPYHCECQKTARLLVEELGLKDDDWKIAFQSRFGRAEWLRPYTIDTMTALGRQKLRRVDVFCPGFASDCLETLEEIAMQNKAAFLKAGGGEFRHIPCLNERHEWILALARVAAENLHGWVTSDHGETAAQASRQRALALGAKD